MGIFEFGCDGYFVDAGTAIATTIDADEGSEPAVRHWLRDGRTLDVYGMSTYPIGPVGS